MTKYLQVKLMDIFRQVRLLLACQSILCQLFAQDWPNLNWSQFNKVEADSIILYKLRYYSIYIRRPWICLYPSPFSFAKPCAFYKLIFSFSQIFLFLNAESHPKTAFTLTHPSTNPSITPPPPNFCIWLFFNFFLGKTCLQFIWQMLKGPGLY